MSGAENGAEQAETWVERSVAENDGAGTERGAGGRGAGTERRAGVTEIGFSFSPLTCSGHLKTLLSKAAAHCDLFLCIVYTLNNLLSMGNYV